MLTTGVGCCAAGTLSGPAEAEDDASSSAAPSSEASEPPRRLWPAAGQHGGSEALAMAQARAAQLRASANKTSKQCARNAIFAVLQKSLHAV